MKETIKDIAGGIGCCLVWAVIIGAAWLWIADGKRQAEARSEAARLGQQIREANQWREQQEMIQYQMKLQRLENDRILREQEDMLLRVQSMRPLGFR